MSKRLLTVLGGSKCVSLPVNLLSTPQTVLESFDTVGEWSAYSGTPTIEAETTIKKEGLASLKITTAAGETTIVQKTVTLDISATEAIRISYYVPDTSKLTSIGLLFSRSTFFSGIVKFFAGVGSPIIQGWNTISLPRSLFTEDNTTWEFLVIRIGLQITPASGQVCTVYIDNLTTGILSNPVCLMTFDDESSTVLTKAYPVMAPLKARGTIYTITDLIGDVGKMTLADLVSLDGKGWDIANHTKDHTNLSTLAQALQEAEFTDAKAVLDAAGLTRASSHVAYPGGVYNADTLLAMAATGMLTGRTVLNGNYEVMPFGDNYYLQCKIYLTNKLTLVDAKKMVDAAILRGAVIAIVGHVLVDSGASTNEWNVADFQALMQYIVSKCVPFVTISELYTLLTETVKVKIK